MESKQEAKESFRISYSLVNNSTSKLQKVSYQSGSERSFEYSNTGAGDRFSAFNSLNFQVQAPGSRTVIQQHQICLQREVTQGLRKCASDVSMFLEFLPNIKNIYTSVLDLLKLGLYPNIFLLGKRSLQTKKHFRLFKG